MSRFPLFLFLLGSAQLLCAGEITGVIGSYVNDEGRSYMGVAVEQTLVTKTLDGQHVRSDFPQLAGLDAKKHAEAKRLMGRLVRITGRPMERHTVNHATPVLWLAEQFKIAEKTDSSALSSRKIEEVPRGSALRAELFDLARPEAEKTAGQRVRFEGSMKRMGDWVYFSGNVVDTQGRRITVRNLASDTLALWKCVDGRWRVLDVGAGVTDAYHYEVWPRQFGTPMELLRGN